jgi:hypothetical protein
MNIEELSTMTESDLRVRANAHLEQLDNRFASLMEKEHHVAQAQVYLAELDRRKQAQERVDNARIAERDYVLEKWVIGLIGAELVLAISAIIFGWVEGNRQMAISRHAEAHAGRHRCNEHRTARSVGLELC